MNATLRSARLLVLAWAMLLAPQMAFVHLLSHSLQSATATRDGDTDPRHPAVAKVCDTCLAFAQMGSALPQHFEWSAEKVVVAPIGDSPVDSAQPRYRGAFEARGPPFLLT